MNQSCLLLSMLLLLGATSARAQSLAKPVLAGDETASFQTEVLLTDLDNPTGLALRPNLAKKGPYELLMAESGAGRVLRVATNAFDQADEVVGGFAIGAVDEQLPFDVGPLAIAFISRTKFVVGAKGDRAGGDFIAGFSLPNAGQVISADKPDHSVGPLKTIQPEKLAGLGFWSMARSEKMVYVTSAGRGAEGFVFKSEIRANRLSFIQAFVDIQKVAGLGSPGGIAMTPEPRPAFLVVALMGSRDTAGDSRLAFFVPSSGELALNLPTGLNDIISLAYSPTGQLYAADVSWQDEQAGGVYRIDDARIEGQQTCRAVEIASLVRPVSVLFTPDGSLYVTTFGEGENAKQGTLVKITGEL